MHWTSTVNKTRCINCTLKYNAEEEIIFSKDVLALNLHYKELNK